MANIEKYKVVVKQHNSYRISIPTYTKEEATKRAAELKSKRMNVKVMELEAALGLK